MTLLTRRAVLLADIEDTYNVAKSLGADDGFLIEDPDYQVDPTRLERTFFRADLSTMPHIIGRKLARMTFRTELRGNGLVDSGNAADAPLICRLFRGCGYSLTALAAIDVSAIYPVGTYENTVAWAETGSPTGVTAPIMYVLTVTTPGASAVAQITVTSDTAGEGNAAAVVTTAVPFTVGAKGLTLTPTFTGDLTTGQRWVLWVFPTGVRLDPVSSGFESLTLEMYFDGVRHQMTGCYGTFELTAEAGQYAMMDWTFIGQYIAPTDAALPSPTYETTAPSMVELAQLRIDDFAAIVNAFNFSQNNEIQPRPDVNSPDGYNGTRLVARNPEGGVDPEADLVANYDFFGNLASAKHLPFNMHIGSAIGNQVGIFAPRAQYTGMTYRDRVGLRTLDAGLRFPRVTGNDEIIFFFG